MQMDNTRHKKVRGLSGLLILALLATISTASAEREEPYKPGTLLADGQVKVAWNITVPVRAIEKIKTIHLLDGHLYAVTNTGQVNAIRAYDGQFQWTGKLADLNEPLWKPTLYYDLKKEGRLAAFTLNTEVVFVNPADGEIQFRREVADVNVAPAAVGPNALYTAEIANRIHKYNIEKEFLDWEIRREGKLRLSPIYRYDEDLLIFADDSGNVAGCGADNKVRQFSTDLQGIPAGLAVDDGAVYVATLDRLLYKVSHKTGNILWKEYLSSRPAAAPALSDGFLYQPLESGLLRLEKDRQEPAHLFEGVKSLLADWPDRLALLDKQGAVLLIDKKTLKPRAEIMLPDAVISDTNVTNAAVFVATPKGAIYCLTPAGPDLKADDFKTPTPIRIEQLRKGEAEEQELEIIAAEDEEQ